VTARDSPAAILQTARKIEGPGRHSPAVTQSANLMRSPGVQALVGAPATLAAFDNVAHILKRHGPHAKEICLED